MEFDPNNEIVKLCAKGMEMEGQQNPEEAKVLFMKAWLKATSDLEKFTAAHYVARHQGSVREKLRWDETALNFALQITDEGVKANYPSLYLNIAKCHEELGDIKSAILNYNSALTYSTFLADDGYGNMIRSGIRTALGRLATQA